MADGVIDLTRMLEPIYTYLCVYLYAHGSRWGFDSREEKEYQRTLYREKGDVVADGAIDLTRVLKPKPKPKPSASAASSKQVDNMQVDELCRTCERVVSQV